MAYSHSTSPFYTVESTQAIWHSSVPKLLSELPTPRQSSISKFQLGLLSTASHYNRTPSHRMNGNSSTNTHFLLQVDLQQAYVPLSHVNVHSKQYLLRLQFLFILVENINTKQRVDAEYDTFITFELFIGHFITRVLSG